MVYHKKTAANFAAVFFMVVRLKMFLTQFNVIIYDKNLHFCQKLMYLYIKKTLIYINFKKGIEKNENMC